MPFSVAGPAEAERIFHALTENGTVQMPMEQTLGAVRFGLCVDRFGVPWDELWYNTDTRKQGSDRRLLRFPMGVQPRGKELAADYSLPGVTPLRHRLHWVAETADQSDTPAALRNDEAKRQRLGRLASEADTSCDCEE